MTKQITWIAKTNLDFAVHTTGQQQVSRDRQPPYGMYAFIVTSPSVYKLLWQETLGWRFSRT